MASDLQWKFDDREVEMLNQLPPYETNGGNEVAIKLYFVPRLGNGYIQCIDTGFEVCGVRHNATFIIRGMFIKTVSEA